MRLKHGHVRGKRPTRTWISWRAMMARCYNSKRDSYQYYGGRGIKVCDRWRDFRAFLADMGEAPDGMSLDRIDPDGDYEPGNARWATATTQARNRTNNRVISTPRGEMCIYAAAEAYGIRPDTLTWRIERGWPVEKALTQKTREWKRAA